MWVKICANTNLEDALLATRLGADAVGFVFTPSARQVTPAEVAQMTPHLPKNVERVGVFPAWPADQIIATITEADLTAVQLHAAFDPSLARSLRESLPPTIKFIQAAHWPVDPSEGIEAVLLQQVEQIESSGRVDRILIDSKIGNASGGTGTPFDWAAAEALFQVHPRLILAGGLQPRNVHEAIARLRPWGVDVASGVEAEPGRKDPEKLKAFINKAKSNRT